MGKEFVANSLDDMCAAMCDNIIPAKSEEHEFCLRCGRKLKNPKARILGYGMTCWKKKDQPKNKRHTLFN